MYPSGAGVDNGGGDAWVGARSMWEISVSSAQYFCERKTTLENKFIF